MPQARLAPFWADYAPRASLLYTHTRCDSGGERFLPSFQKKNSKRPKKKPRKSEAEKAATPFPPAQTPRKVDLQLESGEYFLSDEQKRAKEVERRAEQQASSK